MAVTTISLSKKLLWHRDQYQLLFVTPQPFVFLARFGCAAWQLTSA